MNKEQVIKELIPKLNFEEFGFGSHTHLKNNKCIYFYREVNDRTDIISISYVSHKSKLVISNILNTFVVFKEVNTILQKAVPDIDIKNQMVVEIYPNWEIEKFYDKIYKIANVIILDKEVYFEENLNEVVNVIREYIVDYALPFFDKVKDLNNVHENIIKVIPHMQLGNHLGLFTPSIKQIVMKLYKNPDYDNYIVWLANAIEQMKKDKSILYEGQNRIFIELSKILEDI